MIEKKKPSKKIKVSKDFPDHQLFGSDLIAEALREQAFPYICLNPGASYRGLHDSLVNHIGSSCPFKCWFNACVNGDLQRMVRPFANANPGRNRAAGCCTAPPLD